MKHNTKTLKKEQTMRNYMCVYSHVGMCVCVCVYHLCTAQCVVDKLLPIATSQGEYQLSSQETKQHCRRAI